MLAHAEELCDLHEANCDWPAHAAQSTVLRWMALNEVHALSRAPGIDGQDVLETLFQWRRERHLVVVTSWSSGVL